MSYNGVTSIDTDKEVAERFQENDFSDKNEFIEYSIGSESEKKRRK